MKKSRLVLQLFAIAIAIIVFVFPIIMLLFIPDTIGQHSYVPIESGTVILRTFLWSIGVGLLATIIGWYVGLRIATLRKSIFAIVLLALLMSLAIPCYAVFYAWWQAWPTGTWLHKYVVEHGLLSFAMKSCAFVALVGWSWPIPAFIAAMVNRRNSGLLLLQSLDNPPLLKRILLRLQQEKKIILASVIIVAAITASNTTCFDLAQVSTIGNELRAVISSGGSFISAPWLSLSGVLVALVASFILLRCTIIREHQSAIIESKSLLPIIVIWVLLTGGPLVLSAVSSLGGDGFQLWSQYGGDLFVSSLIALFVALVTSLIVLSSMSMHLSTSKSTQYLASILDFLWILLACLPATMVASIIGNAWHLANLEFVDRTPVILVLAQLTRIGFVGSLAGRWAASCPRMMTLSDLDSPQSLRIFVLAMSPRLLQAICLTIAISVAMSFGEIALTSQLAPPATNHPISVALLNAMHYQRPQIVTSALFVMISFAAISGLLLIVLNKKLALPVLLVCTIISCQHYEEAKTPTAMIIGSSGYTDNHFMTPRAIASDDNIFVVIDKTGRLQRFSHDGIFLSSWELELSGTGFPTGVSIDDVGNIWIADTHQHRILVLDSDGNEVQSFGEYGIEDGQFLYPTDVAFGINGEVYVSEYGGNDRISVFDQQGKFLRSIGHNGEDVQGFRRPQSIAIDSTTGNLFVTDSGNHRIVVLKPSGEVIKIISKVGRQKAQMLYPYGILIDSSNSFLVCEFGTNRLQRFTMDGESIETWGSAGSEIGFFRTPWGIARTADGIVVADTGNNRLQLLPDMMTKQ